MWGNNTTSDESFHYDVLPEIDFMYSTSESENEAAACIFCNEKFLAESLPLGDHFLSLFFAF